MDETVTTVEAVAILLIFAWNFYQAVTTIKKTFAPKHSIFGESDRMMLTELKNEQKQYRKDTVIDINKLINSNAAILHEVERLVRRSSPSRESSK